MPFSSLVKHATALVIVLALAAPSSAQIQKLTFGGTGANLESCPSGYLYRRSSSQNTDCMDPSTIVPSGGTPGYYGSFYDTTDQTNPVANVEREVKINNTDISNGVTRSLGKYVAFAHTGVYNVQFSFQFQNTGSSEARVRIWIKQGFPGVQIPWSSGDVDVPKQIGGVPGHVLPSWNYLVNITSAPDVIEFFWASDSTSVTLETNAAGTSPVSPDVPSVIVTAQQVTNVQLGPTGATGPTVYPASGVANSTGTAWGTSYAVSGSSGNVPLVNVATAPTANKVMKWDGSNWVPGDPADPTEFSFLVLTFPSPASALQEIGAPGTWKSAGALSFTATYKNPSPTSATVQTSPNAWGSSLNMGSPYTGPTVSTATTSYPTPSGSSYGTVSFTLSAAKGSSSSSATSTVTFGNGRFWGTSTSTGSYTEAQVEALAGSGSGALATSRTTTGFTVVAGAGEYVLFAYPTRMGLATFVDNATGFAFSMLSPETLTTRTNGSSFPESYYVYRSTYAGLGTVSVKVN